ncbi:MAG: hypothetical protein KAR44_07250 [Candidatus Aegiribacteria sp.]|nr:hypothetical protein [Candidatus Aegiribacteria sp.]
MIFIFLFSSLPDRINLHNLTFINRVRDVQIVSLYIWGSDQPDKGDSWIATALQPDCAVTFSLPSGKCNLLAFDELGNSYGIAGNIQKNAPDTILIDLEYITFGRPNVDYGQYLLNLTNSLNGFALDTLILSSAQLDEDIVLDNFRIFPGNSIIVWLEKGIYSVSAVDQIGRTYSIDNIIIPHENRIVSIFSNMVTAPEPPIGITGNGTGSFLIENCLPIAITELQIVPQNGSDGIYLDSIALQPGESMIANLNPGFYAVLATDESNAEYYVSVEQQDTGISRLPITIEYLKHDFSFSKSSED